MYLHVTLVKNDFPLCGETVEKEIIKLRKLGYEIVNIEVEGLGDKEC